RCGCNHGLFGAGRHWAVPAQWAKDTRGAAVVTGRAPALILMGTQGRASLGQRATRPRPGAGVARARRRTLACATSMTGVRKLASRRRYPARMGERSFAFRHLQVWRNLRAPSLGLRVVRRLFAVFPRAGDG